MDNLKPEIIRNLLDTLVTPKFDDIVDYNIKTKLSDDGKVAVAIDVVMKPKLDDSLYIKQRELGVEGRIRDVMKYLSPLFTVVEFYVTNDY
jgi:hypothetical protein